MILVMSVVLPLAEVKAKFSEMVDRVEQQHDRITVTRNGRPAAVLSLLVFLVIGFVILQGVDDRPRNWGGEGV